MGQLTKTQRLITVHTLSMENSIRIDSRHVDFLRRLSGLAGQVLSGRVHEDVLLEMLRAFPVLPATPLRDKQDATDQLRVVNSLITADWLSEDKITVEYDMLSMYLGDASDHLAVALMYRDGESPSTIQNMLWNMDTASRDQASDEVWSYAYGECQLVDM